MTYKLADRVKETTSAPGTSTATLSGAATGYQSFSAGIGANNTTCYVIADQIGANWEVGIGTVGSGGTTLVRTTVLSSSNSGSLVNFASGTQDVWVDYPASKAVIVNDVGDVLVNQSTDQGTGVLQVTGQSTFNGAVTDKSLNLQGGNNLLTYSQDFTNAAWVKINSTTSATLVVAPDGTTTANKIVESSANNRHIEYNSITALALTYTFSVYLKADTRTVAQVQFGNGGLYYAALVNLSTGAIIANTSSGSPSNTGSSIYPVGNGWHRVSVTCTTTATTAYPVIALSNSTTPTYDSNGNPTYIGDGTSDILVWGAQLELGSVASNYTPTTTAAVTTTNNINVPSGQVLAGNGSVSLPSYSFGTSTGTGMGWDGANYFASTGGVVRGYWNSNGLNLNTNQIFILSSTGAITFSPDTTLARDAANTLAQRNSTNAQTFRLYNTYTDASNYERLSVDWSSVANTASITTQNAGTGSSKDIRLFAGNNLFLGAGGTSSLFTITTGGVLQGSVDNTRALGATSLRFSNIYTYGLNASTTIQTGGYTVATLPTGVVGMRAYVTNALAPAYGVAVAGGGAVTIPVFYNGTNWICA